MQSSLQDILFCKRNSNANFVRIRLPGVSCVAPAPPLDGDDIILPTSTSQELARERQDVAGFYAAVFVHLSGYTNGAMFLRFFIVPEIICYRNASCFT